MGNSESPVTDSFQCKCPRECETGILSPELLYGGELFVIEYKLTASAIVFSLTLVLAGSYVTLEDWEQLGVQQKIELIEKNISLDEGEKRLLVDMLETNDDSQELEKLFSERASELRLEASKAINPIEKIKLGEAAGSFETSLKRLSRIRSYEDSLESVQRKLAGKNYTPELEAGIKRSRDKLLAEYEIEKRELNFSLVQGFLAVKAAENSEKVLMEKSDEVAKIKPDPGDLDIKGPITVILGFMVSVLGGLKLILDYKKAKIDLQLAQMKLGEKQE